MALALESFVPASIVVTYAAGMLTALSPCVLPLLPIVVGGAMQRHRAAPLLMGIGMTTAFAVTGWMLGALGPAMDLDAEWIHQAAAISLIVFGIALWIDPLANLISRLVQPLENSADRLAGAVGHQSPAAALFFGGLLGLAWSPCAGPMLVSSWRWSPPGATPPWALCCWACSASARPRRW
ncbi:MAG: sulfite exporter TauE/SafE family protein [Sulfuritalea sp.]|nr:sulfite exporter TauE/SafE family protein [Sulfuritalea sp.]